MHIELELAGDEDLPELEAWLRQDPRLDDAGLTRGRPAVRDDDLGAAEVLELVATNVGLGVVANALYDYLRGRAASRPVRLRLTRTDRPGGPRRVEIEASGSAEAVERIVRAALDDGRA